MWDSSLKTGVNDDRRIAMAARISAGEEKWAQAGWKRLSWSASVEPGFWPVSHHSCTAASAARRAQPLDSAAGDAGHAEAVRAEAAVLHHAAGSGDGEIGVEGDDRFDVVVHGQAADETEGLAGGA